MSVVGIVLTIYNVLMEYIVIMVKTVHSVDKCLLNTLRLRQNGSHFADDILKSIFLCEISCILFKISLKFVSNGANNNNPALDQIMVWCQSGWLSLPMHICVTQPQ